MMAAIERRKAIDRAYELYGRMLDLDDAHIEDAVRVAIGVAFDAGAATNQGAVEALREIAAWIEIETKDGGTKEVPMDGYTASMKARVALSRLGGQS